MRLEKGEKFAIALALVALSASVALQLVSFIAKSKYFLGFFLSVVVLTAIYPILHFAKARWTRAIAFVVLFAAVGVLKILVWPPVYPPFDEVAKDLSGELGKPLSSPSRLGNPDPGAYQGVFSNAVHLWTIRGAYILWSGDNSWEPLIEGCLPDNSEDWYSEPRLRKALKLPDSCRPPVGSMAREWLKDPDKWSKIGCREWHCPSTPRVFYQRFENGTLLGVFRGGLEGVPPGLVYVLFEKPNRHWETVRIEASHVPDGLATTGAENCTP